MCSWWTSWRLPVTVLAEEQQHNLHFFSFTFFEKPWASALISNGNWPFVCILVELWFKFIYLPLAVSAFLQVNLDAFFVVPSDLQCFLGCSTRMLGLITWTTSGRWWTGNTLERCTTMCLPDLSWGDTHLRLLSSCFESCEIKMDLSSYWTLYISLSYTDAIAVEFVCPACVLGLARICYALLWLAPYIDAQRALLPPCPVIMPKNCSYLSFEVCLSYHAFHCLRFALCRSHNLVTGIISTWSYNSNFTFNYNNLKNGFTFASRSDLLILRYFKHVRVIDSITF